MAKDVSKRGDLSPKVHTGQLTRMTSRTVVNNLVPIDDEVDRVFGEPVVLKPMKTVSGGYRDPVSDPGRNELITRGVFDQSRGAVEETGGGSIHRQSTVDTTLSIREEPVKQIDLRKGDRVYFPERDELHEVTFIDAEPGGRPEVHLVRVLE
jgi:hypothetical protein